jgi:hypothetical protein
MTVRLRGVVYRYHPKAHLHDGHEFWRMFVDGSWKWKAKQRFAGVDLNPGHFFATLLDKSTRATLRTVGGGTAFRAGAMSVLAERRGEGTAPSA